MMYNPKDFPGDPENFVPQRFLKMDGGKYTLRDDVRDPEDIAFGFGRRYAVVELSPLFLVKLF